MSHYSPHENVSWRRLLVAAVALSLIGPAVTPLAAAAGGTTVSIAAADTSVDVGQSTTFEVEVDESRSGVGAAEFGVAVDGNVAEITDVEVLGSGATSTNIAADGSSADVQYAFRDTSDSGSVTVAEVTVRGVSDGSTDVRLEPTADQDAVLIFDESGSGYDVTDTNSAALSVEAGSNAIDGGDDSDDRNAGGGSGSSGTTGDTDKAADVDVVAVDDGATVSVSGLSSGDDVEADINGKVAGQGVALQSITTAHRITPDEDYRVELANVGAEPTGSASRLDGAAAIGYLTVEPIGTDRIERATIGFTVEDGALPVNTSPEAVRLYHYADGWEELDTEHVGSDGGVHEFTATTTGFPSFAIGVGTAEIEVTESALASEEVTVGDTVSVTATVENHGRMEGTTIAALTVDGEVRDEVEVTVPAGERTEVTLTMSLDETGEYSVAVDEASAGDLSVVDPDPPTDPEGDATADTGDGPVIEEQTPGFGVLPVLAAGATLLGYLRFRRQAQ